MPGLGHERYLKAINEETALLRETLQGADLEVTVPTCPDWTLRQLAEHVGRAHRWAEAIVRTRAKAELPDDTAEAPADAEGLDGWLAAGAERLTEALAEAGPDTAMWTWWPPEQRSGFWARRMTLETVVHRADAALAAGRPYEVDAALAADVIDEWLEFCTWPPVMELKAELTGLLGTGQTIHLHATDVPGAEWLIVRGPQAVTWSREHAKGDVALRGTVTDLMLAFQRRLPLDSERLEVFGDRALFDHWLSLTSF